MDNKGWLQKLNDLPSTSHRDLFQAEQTSRTSKRLRRNTFSARTITEQLAASGDRDLHDIRRHQSALDDVLDQMKFRDLPQKVEVVPTLPSGRLYRPKTREFGAHNSTKSTLPNKFNFTAIKNSLLNPQKPKKSACLKPVSSKNSMSNCRDAAKVATELEKFYNKIVKKC